MTWRAIASRRLTNLINRLAVCDGGCRQHPTKCACDYVPPLPEEL